MHIMLIKQPGASGDLKVSHALTSILDTAETINSILGLDEKFKWRSIIDIPQTEQRERRNYFYEWESDDNTTDYTKPIQEYIIDGSIYDQESWHLGRRFVSPDGRK